MALLLSFFLKFWKPLLILIIISGSYFYVKNWYSDKLEEAYSRGAKDQLTSMKEEHERIIRDSEEMFQRNAELLEENQKIRAKKQENISAGIERVIRIYEKDINSCSPHPEYLRMWDHITNDTSDETLSSDDGSIEELSHPPTF